MKTRIQNLQFGRLPSKICATESQFQNMAGRLNHVSSAPDLQILDLGVKARACRGLFFDAGPRGSTTLGL
jgi:hypothetical protein